MRSPAMFAPDPQNPDPSAGQNIFCCQKISAFVITMAYTFPTPVTVVAFQREHIQHGDKSSIRSDQHGRIFFFKAGKDIAMMKIYRYHGYDVLRWNERGRLVAKLGFLSHFYSESFPLSLLIPDYITGREILKE